MNISRSLAQFIRPFIGSDNSSPSQTSGVALSPSAVTSPTTSDSSSNTVSASNGRDSFRSDFASMLKAVQAGDITTAQSALTSLQSDVQSAGYSTDSVSSASGSTSTASTPQTDLDALFQAVKTGDASGAQAALTKLQSDAQDAATQQNSDASSGQAVHGHGHRHHHHHGGGGGIEAAVAQAFGTSSSSSSSSGTSSSDTPDATVATAAA